MAGGREFPRNSSTIYGCPQTIIEAIVETRDYRHRAPRQGCHDHHPERPQKASETQAAVLRHIEQGFHLGYRKGAAGSSWVVRLRRGDGT